MDTLEKIKNGLSDRDCEIVAKRTGLSAQTVRALKTGRSKNPNLETVKLLVAYLRIKP